MEKEGSINCNCVDIVYDERSKSLKNGKYETVDNVDRGNNIFIPVGDFDVKSKKLPEHVIKTMEANRNIRPTKLAQNAVNEAKHRAQTAQGTRTGDMYK